MRSRRVSLRLRISALATVAVAAALVVVAVVLVWTVERTAVGQVRDAARAEVDRVAGAVEAGRPVTEPGDATDGRSDVLVVVQDASGGLVDAVSSGGLGGRVHPLPEGIDLSELNAALHGDAGHQDERGFGDRHGHVPDTRIAGDDGDLVVASRTVESPDGQRTVTAISPLAAVANSIAAVNRALWVAAPLLLLFVGGTAWVAVDRSLRPVEEIRRRADAISHSTLSDRLPEPGPAAELSGLTGTLNEMLERLEIGARRQREFITDASHELRTPLAAMRTELEVALARTDASQWQGVARRLLKDQRRLEQLTSDLLTLARLEETQGPAEREPADLSAIVAAEADTVSAVEVKTMLHSVQVRASEADLTRLVCNLLDNAVRYADRTVAVGVHAQNGHAILTVDDDGPGIPAPDRERVFQRFARLDSSRARTSGGVGIGLALVQRVAEGHGGWVTISDSPLGGARLEVRFPQG